jgi:pyruvate,water dikinase
VDHVAWFNQLTRESIPFAGGKGANLGEMTNAGFPIPQGFVVTAQTYFEYVNRTSIQPKILEIANGVDTNDSAALDDASKRISEIMLSVPMLPDITDAITVAYRELCRRRGDQQLYVAARSSATAEDLPEASFAGQQATFLDVQGDNELIKAVRKCWASLYTPRAIFYRKQQGFAHDKVGIAVVVQEMIKSEVAGVMFTREPTGQNDKIIIEGAYGLGESVVSGMVTPDHYEVDRNTKEIVVKTIGKQEQAIVRNERGRGTIQVPIQEMRQELQKLPDKKVVELAEIGAKIEEHYNFPQDIEWALQEGQLFIVQSRAITTLKRKMEAPTEEVKGESMAQGMGASPGVATGQVKVVHDMSDLNKVEKGDILITKMTSPDMVPAMKKAAAIVTDEGGLTCHAAIVSRELGVPCIVGTGNITTLVKDGDIITVDASHGKVFKGALTIAKEEEIDAATIRAMPPTRTRIYMNLGVPDMAEKYKDIPVDGIGLMREEFIIATSIKEHPNKLIKDGRGQVFVDKLAEGVATVARAFAPRPVVLRLSDFKTNEYKDLEGGAEFEPREDNPMIGWRGCSRYYSPAYAEAFKLEVKAIKKVRDELGCRNVWVMLPFTRTVEEVMRVSSILEEGGLKRGPDFKLWLMAEIPSNALLAEEFAEHCDGFSIGSNDLTQLVLGVDRDSEMLGKMGLFEERNAAVVKAIKMIIAGGHKKGITVSLCGQAPSNYPDFARVLVEAGIDSISVNPDAVGKVKRVVLQVEKELGIVAPPKPAEPAPPTETVAVPEAAPPAEEAQAPAAVQTTLAPAKPQEPDVCPKCYKPRAQCTCNKGFKVFGLKIL